jgi:mRNA interferase RelE/StbE
MTYSLEFHEDALKEWNDLDGSIKSQFKKQLEKRMENPHVPSARLSSDLGDCYKIKLQKIGYRLVYEVIDRRLVIIVLSVGRRDRFQAYMKAGIRR